MMIDSVNTPDIITATKEREVNNMGAFNEYVEKANNTAKQAFEEYLTAKDKYDRAKEKIEKTPLGKDLREQAAFSRAKADYNDAADSLRDAKRVFEHHKDDFEKIRGELASAIEKHYTVDPADVDASTLALLNSGILKTADFEKLMDTAEKAENLTMIRLIADRAKDAEKKASAGGNDMSEKSQRLRAVYAKANDYDGREYLDAFDTLSDLFRRCVENDYMISRWDELSGGIMEIFD